MRPSFQKTIYSQYGKRNTYNTTSFPSQRTPMNTSLSLISNEDYANNLLTNENEHISKVNKILQKSNLDRKNQLKQYEKFTTENTLTNENLLDLKTYSDQLKKELANSSKKNTELLSSYDEIEQKIEEINANNQNLQNELNSLNDVYKREIKENGEIKSKYETILKKYQTEYTLKQNKIKELSNQNEKIFNNNKEIEAVNEELKTDLAKYEELISNLNLTIQTLSNTKASVKYKGEIEKRIMDNKNELNKKEEYINNLLAENEKLKEKNEEKLSQLRALQETIKEKEESYQSINQMKNDINVYSEKIKKLFEISASKDKTISQLQQSYNTLYQILNNDKEERDVEAQYLEAKAKNDLLAKNIEELGQIAKGLLDSGNQMKNKYENMIAQLKSSLEKCSDFSKEKEKILQENEELRAKNQAIEEKMKSLPKFEKSFEDIKKENEQLEKENEFLKTQPQRNSEHSEALSTNQNQNQLNPLLFTLFKNKFLGYDFQDKKYYFAPVPAGYDDFLIDYLPNVEGTIISSILEAMFIVTGNEHNILYLFSQKETSVMKINEFHYNHKYGALINIPNSRALLMLSGVGTPSVEKLSLDSNMLSDMPPMKYERAHASYCFVDLTLYAFFGFNHKTNNYVKTIEFLDVQNGTEWNEFNYETNELLELKSHSSLYVNNNEILIVGGVRGAEEEGNKNMITFHIDEKRVEVTELIIPFIDLVGGYKFDKNKQFTLIIDGKGEEESPYLVSMDDMANIHSFGRSAEYNVELFKTE